MSKFSKIKDKLDGYALEVWLFVKSFTFWKNFLGIIAMFAIFLLLTSWWMRCYTNHGESLQVHDYIGMDLDDAMKKAKDRSFSIVVNDSLYVPGKAPNMVISQDPNPLSRVKEKRKIYLTVTKKDAELMTLPNLYGGSDDYISFQRKLKRIGVNSRIVGRRFNSKLEENTILEVIFKGDTITEELDARYKVPKGSTVEFVVTERGGGKVPIPNLICQKYDGARFIVGNFNLNVGSIIEDATVTNTTTAYIWKQVPRYRRGEKLRIGEQIDLYLTQRKPDNCDPNEEDHIEDDPQGDPEEVIDTDGEEEEDEEF